MQTNILNLEAVLYLEKIDIKHQVPVASISIDGSVGSPATCTVVVPPVNNVLEIEPRTMGYVFYREKGGPLKLAFIGEYLSSSCQFTRTSRMISLNFADPYHFLNSIYLYQRSWEQGSENFLSDLSVLEGGLDAANIVNSSNGGVPDNIVHKTSTGDIGGALTVNKELVTSWTSANAPDHLLGFPPPTGVNFPTSPIGVEWWYTDNKFFKDVLIDKKNLDTIGFSGKAPTPPKYSLSSITDLYKNNPSLHQFNVIQGEISINHRVNLSSSWTNLDLITKLVDASGSTITPSIVLDVPTIKIAPDKFKFINDTETDASKRSTAGFTINNIDISAEVGNLLLNSTTVAKQLDPDINTKIESLFTSIVGNKKQRLTGYIVLSLGYQGAPVELVLAGARCVNLLYLDANKLNDFISSGISSYLSFVGTGPKTPNHSIEVFKNAKSPFFGDMATSVKMLEATKALNLRIFGISLEDSKDNLPSGMAISKSPEDVIKVVDPAKQDAEIAKFKSTATVKKYFDSFKWGVGVDTTFFASAFIRLNNLEASNFEDPTAASLDASTTSESIPPYGKSIFMNDVAGKIKSSGFEAIELENSYKSYSNSAGMNSPLRKFTLSLQVTSPEDFIKGHQKTCIGMYYDKVAAGIGSSNSEWISSFEANTPGGTGDTILNCLYSAFAAEEKGDMGKVIINFIAGLCNADKVNPYVKYMLFRNKTMELIGSTINDSFANQFYKKDYIKDVWLDQVGLKLGLITTIGEVLGYVFNKIYYAYSPFLFPNTIISSTLPGSVKVKEKEETDTSNETETKKEEEVKNTEPTKEETPKEEIVKGTEVKGTHIPSMLFNPLTYFFNAPTCNKIKEEEYVSFNFTRQPLTEITRLGSSIVNWASNLGNSSVPIPRAAIQSVIVSPTIIFHKDSGDIPNIKQTQAVQEHEEFTGIVPDWRNVDDFITNIMTETINTTISDTNLEPTTNGSPSSGEGLSSSSGAKIGAYKDWLDRLIPLIKKYSSEFSFDPAFVCAIIRQETGWGRTYEKMRKMTSPVGACGFMQVMPGTGREIARALKVTPFSASDLYTPEISIRFGVYYLSERYKQFGRLDYTAASYNAGPGSKNSSSGGGVWPKINKYKKLYGKDPSSFDDIAAWMPKETRGYVLNVMSFYAQFKEILKGY